MPKPKSTGTGIRKRNQQVSQSATEDKTEDDSSGFHSFNQDEPTDLKGGEVEDESTDLTEDKTENLIEDESTNLTSGVVDLRVVEDEPTNKTEDLTEAMTEQEVVAMEVTDLEVIEQAEQDVIEQGEILNDGSDVEVKVRESEENKPVENAVVVQQQQTELHSSELGQVDEAKFSEGELETGLHFTDGEKGGVGKSLFCRVLLEYCNTRGYKDRIQFVESDISNPDVGRIYFTDEDGNKDYIEAEFTNEEKKRSSADKIFELATEKTVIVNLPSNIYSSVTDWFERNHIATLAKDQNIKIYKWFVCNGGHSSIDKFKESVNDKKLKDITHIFVRNQVIFDDWTIIEKDKDLAEILARKNVFQMDFPQFSFEERNRVDAGQLTFGKALADGSGFGILSKQRIKNFLNATYAELDRLNLLP